MSHNDILISCLEKWPALLYCLEQNCLWWAYTNSNFGTLASNLA